jgi:hypothetical protein
MRRFALAAAAVAALVLLGVLAAPPGPARKPRPTRKPAPERPVATARPEPRPAAAAPASDVLEPSTRPQAPGIPREAVARLLEALRRGDREGAKKAQAELLAALRPSPVPEGENAALLYRRAFEKLVDATDAEEEALCSLAGETPLTAGQEALVRGYLERNREALALARQAADRPRCDFGLDLAAGMNAELSHVAPLIRLSKLLHAEAFLAGEGDRGAIARAALRAADATAEEPFLISQLVRNVCHGLAAESYARVLAGPADAAYLEDMAGRLAPEALRAGLGRGLLGDLALGLQSLLTAESLEELGLAGVRPLDDPLAMQDVAHYAETLAEAAALAARPYYLAREPLRVLWETRIEAAPAYADFSRQLLPAFTRAAERQAVAEATVGVSRVATALAIYRARHGTYPLSLEGLGAGLPSDPFTGKPYLYRREGTGFVLYSAGPAGADHAGTLDEPGLVLRRSW